MCLFSVCMRCNNSDVSLGVWQLEIFALPETDTSWTAGHRYQHVTRGGQNFKANTHTETKYYVIMSVR
jgi:hypothetical protein